MTVSPSDVRLFLSLPKKATEPAMRWRSDPIVPRLGPFPKTRPAPPGGVWRSLRALADEHRFMVFAQVQEGRENFKACLALEQDSSWRILIRLEYHGSHPGLHIHDWCGAVPPLGGKSFEAPYRRPKVGFFHRRVEVPSRATFWTLALNCFRVAPKGEQGELL